MAKYYYQQINDIGKEIAIVSSYTELNDPKHYRATTEEYYNAVIEFLKEVAKASEDMQEQEQEADE